MVELAGQITERRVLRQQKQHAQGARSQNRKAWHMQGFAGGLGRLEIGEGAGPAHELTCP